MMQNHYVRPTYQSALSVFEAGELRRLEWVHGLSFVALVSLLAGFVALLFGITGIPNVELVNTVVAGVWLVTCVAIIGIAYLGGRGHISAAHPKPIERNEPEMTTPPAPPALPPALPPEIETIRVKAGDRVEDIPRNLIQKWLDPRDLEWIADWLANGNRWTEATLEKVPLPFSREKFGKAEGQTPYQKLFGVPDGLLLRAGVIVGRGGAGNSAGKLAVTDAAEIVRRIRQLS